MARKCAERQLPRFALTTVRTALISEPQGVVEVVGSETLISVEAHLEYSSRFGLVREAVTNSTR